MNTKNTKKFLSLNEMLSDIYRDVTIGKLMEEYTLEIEKYPLGSYIYYTPDQLGAHYQLEVKLARKLKDASKMERRKLYSDVYNELFRKIPFHPQLIKKSDPVERMQGVRRTVGILRKYLTPNSTFLELGPGDCQLSFEVAKHVKKVYAIDVSSEVTRSIETPDNFELIISDGSSIEVLPGSVNLAYSNQLMEHLHPEDVVDQLSAIHRALMPGGMYYCVTPHRFGGPTDVSRFFDKEAKGFHLKEYALSEIFALLKTAGFSKVYLPKRLMGNDVNFPVYVARMLESIIQKLPHEQRRKRYRQFQKLLAIRVIAQK